MNYTTYSPVNGRILSVVSSKKLAGRQPAIEGTWAADLFYIKNGRPVPYPAVPGDANNYRWDLATESWIFDPVRAAANIRRIRSMLLEPIDRVNPIWYASLSAEQQTQLQGYRQALLDVTDQPGFPASVVWPAKPGWL